MTGVNDAISKERRRRVGATHDDGHTVGDLADFIGERLDIGEEEPGVAHCIECGCTEQYGCWDD